MTKSPWRPPILCRLGGFLDVLCYSRPEVEHLFRDIFEEQCYLRNGVTLRRNACVFDVGANVGLFSLFVFHHCPSAEVFAFEPAPPLVELLRANTVTCNDRIKVFECGLSAAIASAQLIFYPYNSGMSSFFANPTEDLAVLEAIIRNEIAANEDDLGELLCCIDVILEQRSKGYPYECRLRRLSDVIDEYDVEVIDLLKIDVQKSELDVVAGIRDDHWPLIRQIVMEVHDISDRKASVLDLLAARGFHAIAEQGQVYTGTPLHNIFAVRP